MLFGIDFKIDVMQQAAKSPEFGIFAIFLGKPAHNAFNSQSMLNVKRFLIVFLQQGQSLLTGEFHNDSS